MKPPFDPLAVCASMGEAAQRQDWPALAALEEAFSADMRHLLATTSPAGREQEFAALLSEVLQAYETLISLSGTVRQELADQLQGLQRGQQARDAYKECT